MLPGWLSKPEGWNLLCLRESRCAQHRAMLLLISCQRAERQHMSSRNTRLFFPPFCLTPNTAKNLSLLSWLLLYSSSTLLPPPVITGFCHRLCEGVPTSPLSAHLYHIVYHHKHTHTHSGCLPVQIPATKLQITAWMRSCLASSIIHQRKNFKWCQNLFKKRSFFFAAAERNR